MVEDGQKRKGQIDLASQLDSSTGNQEFLY